jgi:hypothetical protein
MKHYVWCERCKTFHLKVDFEEIKQEAIEKAAQAIADHIDSIILKEMLGETSSPKEDKPDITGNSDSYYCWSDLRINGIN